MISELLHLHYIGLLLGVGGAGISAILMLLIGSSDQRRYRLGRICRRISIITWIGVGFLLISGIGLSVHYYPELSKPLLAGKCLACAIILGDALIIHFRLFPRYFHEIGRDGFDSAYRNMRQIGALSITCWIAAIVLGFLL